VYESAAACTEALRYRRRVKREVQALDGTTWHIASRWYRRPRYRSPDDFFEGLDASDGLTFLDVPFDEPVGFVGAVVIGIVLTLVLAVVVAFLLPLVLFVLELPLVFALVFVIRRLWIVEAVSESGVRHAWHVRGWRRSRRAVAEVAGELERGVRAEPDEALGPA
jgi:ABC-type multidrug transport system fused ATPase/permease subunit